jgi:hypothetical protein
MLLFLRGLFIVVILSMLWVTSWASLHCPLFSIPRAVFTHPWFIATLFDAYWAFITFSVWVCFKQTAALARFAWFVAIILLGNIAMASYCLNELFHVPADGKISGLLTERRSGPGWLGLGLAALGVTVTLLGLKQ